MNKFQKGSKILRPSAAQGMLCTKSSNYHSLFCSTLEEAFALAGMSYPGITPTAKAVVRFPTNDRRGDTAGWCYSFLDGQGAVFGDWRRGTTFVWHKRSHGVPFSNPVEISQARAEAAHARRQIQHDMYEKSACKATCIWKRSIPVLSHPYLVKKCINAYGIRAAFWPQGFRDTETGERQRVAEPALIVPICDSAGKLWSVAAIAPDGRKDFLRGGKKKECFHRIGNVGATICIAEGYATAATIHEATGYAVFIAFDAGNLVSVAAAIRSKYPAAHIIVCADNDQQTPGNPGLTKGSEAARAIGGFLALPSFEKDAM